MQTTLTASRIFRSMRREGVFDRGAGGAAGDAGRGDAGQVRAADARIGGDGRARAADRHVDGEGRDRVRVWISIAARGDGGRSGSGDAGAGALAAGYRCIERGSGGGDASGWGGGFGDWGLCGGGGAG